MASSDQIFDEFVSYQLLKKEDIPEDVWDSAIEEVENSSSKQSFVRMDAIWAFLGVMKTGDKCNYKFGLLSRIANWSYHTQMLGRNECSVWFV